VKIEDSNFGGGFFAYIHTTWCHVKGYGPKWHNLTSSGCQILILRVRGPKWHIRTNSRAAGVFNSILYIHTDETPPCVYRKMAMLVMTRKCLGDCHFFLEELGLSLTINITVYNPTCKYNPQRNENYIQILAIPGLSGRRRSEPSKKLTTRPTKE